MYRCADPDPAIEQKQRLEYLTALLGQLEPQVAEPLAVQPDAPAAHTSQPRVADRDGLLGQGSHDDASLELVRGVGPSTLAKLRAAGIHTGAELASLDGPGIARIAGMQSGLGVKRLESCVRAARDIQKDAS